MIRRQFTDRKNEIEPQFPDGAQRITTALNTAVADWLRKMSPAGVASRVAVVLDEMFEALVLLVVGVKKDSFDRYEWATTNGARSAAFERLKNFTEQAADAYMVKHLATINCAELPAITQEEFEHAYRTCFRRAAERAYYARAEADANAYVDKYAKILFAELEREETPNEMLERVAPDVYAESALVQDTGK